MFLGIVKCFYLFVWYVLKDFIIRFGIILFGKNVYIFLDYYIGLKVVRI